METLAHYNTKFYLLKLLVQQYNFYRRNVTKKIRWKT
jgi:hypothetical protein